MNLTLAVLMPLAGSATRLMDCWCRDYLSLTSSSVVQWQHCSDDPQSPYLKKGVCPTLADVPTEVVSLARAAELYRTQSPAWEDSCRGLMEHAGGPKERGTLRRMLCGVAAECARSCSASGLEDNEWNEETLASSRHREHLLSEALAMHWRIMRSVRSNHGCSVSNFRELAWHHNSTHGLQFRFPDWLQSLSDFRRRNARLLSHALANIAQLFVPLGYKHMLNDTTQRQLNTWKTKMGTVWNLLETRLRALVDDLAAAADEIQKYTLETDKETSGNYVLKRPLLSDNLLQYHEGSTSYSEDFGAQCEQQLPEAPHMLKFADAVYHQLFKDWFPYVRDFVFYINSKNMSIVDETWEPRYRNESTMSVDTGCVQTLVDSLEHPWCPLVEMPLKTAQRQQQCRVQLWKDLRRGIPYIPVTSYLAYTQRINVNICLLSWMVASPKGICQNVPFRMVKSVREARCLLSNSEDHLCEGVDNGEAICSVSRAFLAINCQGFYSTSSEVFCSMVYSIYKKQLVQAQKTINYRSSVGNNTLKYRDFRIKSLVLLEIIFIAINVLFRLMTAIVYLLLPKLRNLPGRLLFCFQLTGIIQILFSEVVYRMGGVPDLSTIVQVDSSLTLLNCMWLNAFCYQMFASIRHLRLPNDLHPSEVRKAFRAQSLYVMLPWSVATAAFVTMERLNEDYLFHSRVLLLAAVSLSVAANIVLLGLVGYMWLRTHYIMQRLKITSGGKAVTKKQAVYMSAKAVILSGVGILIRLGFHQAQGIAQVVYCVHVATMAQGPLLFILFACNGTAFPLLRDRLLSWWHPDVIRPGQELCSSERRNMRRRNEEQPQTAEGAV